MNSSHENTPLASRFALNALRLIILGVALSLLQTLFLGIPEVVESLREHGKAIPNALATFDRLGESLSRYRWLLLGAIVAIAFYNLQAKDSLLGIKSIKGLIALLALLAVLQGCMYFAMVEPILEIGDI